ncbi:hypothetical protein B566_EDAN015441 [Ephemera danica]|nr:hypothetical protein B566_EDAN015441 [Ephemera danica]
MAASYDKTYVDFLQEELRKRDTEIQELTSELVAKRQALESAEEWLNEAMNLRDDFERHASAAQARVMELQTLLSHSQEKCATLKEELATLKQACEVNINTVLPNRDLYFRWHRKCCFYSFETTFSTEILQTNSFSSLLSC